jgi:hypothetical protein
VAVPGLVSDTVTVHVVASLTGTDARLHVTDVDVERWVAVRLKLPELVR